MNGPDVATAGPSTLRGPRGARPPQGDGDREASADASALILVHAGGDDHLRPFVALASIERVELLGGADERRETLRGQRRLDLGRFERVAVRRFQALDDVLRR